MRVVLTLPDRLLEPAEVLAHQRGLSLDQLLAEALAEYLARHTPDAITDAINRLVDEEGGELEPLVREAARRRLKTIDW